MKNKVMIVGARGQLGRELMSTRPSGWEVIGLDREEMDVTMEDSVLTEVEKHRPSVIVNCSAYTNVERAELDPDSAFGVNTIGVKNLAKACSNMGIWLIHVSTDYVFDGQKTGTPYVESDLPNPINTYGRSKLAGELVVRSYLSRFTIIRTAGLYGRWGARGKGTNFPLRIMGLAKEKGEIRVVKDVVTSPTYVRDLAGYIWEIIPQDGPFGVLHVVNQGVVSWYEFAIYLISKARINAKVIAIDSSEFVARVNRPRWTPLASEKGISLRSWQDAVEDFLRELGYV